MNDELPITLNTWLSENPDAFKRPPEERLEEDIPWNKGLKGVYKSPGVAEANRRRVWTEEMKEKSRAAGRKNKGNKRPDLAEWNRKNAGKGKRGTDGRFTKKT